MSKLDFDYVIAGHGDVMRGKQTLDLWKQYFRDLLDQTGAAYADGATLDQGKKRVSDYLIAKYAAKFDPRFPQSVGSNVIKAYQVIAFAPRRTAQFPSQATTTKLFSVVSQLVELPALSKLLVAGLLCSRFLEARFWTV